MENTKKVSGSIIQRSIVPKELSTILNIASVPSSDIGYKKSLKLSVAQLLGVATADCISDSEYNRSLQIVGKPEFWSEIEDFYHDFYGPPFDIFLHRWYHYFFRKWYEKYFKDVQEERFNLSHDILLCQLGGVNINNAPAPWFPYPLPFPYFPLKREFEYIDKFLRRFKIKPEHFSLALKIRASALLVPDRVRISLKEIYEYHVPFGQSPETKSETLRNVIKQAKSIVVAPLMTGAMSSANLLSMGHYVLAVECALASGISTIILVASVSIADRVLEHLSKKRSEEEERDEQY